MEPPVNHGRGQPERGMVMTAPGNRRWQNAIAVLACGSLACACHSIPISERFDAGAAHYVLQNGSNVISGQAYVIVPPFDHRLSCVYNGMQLIPVTPYSTERMIKAFGNASAGYARRGILEMLPEDEAFGANTRHANCDDGGYFRFEHVADGNYYLLTKIYWQVRFSRAGGELMKVVNVRDAESVNIEMTKDLTSR